MSEEYPPIPRVHPIMAAIAAGALWGALGYAVLWGLSPIVVGRRFVVSVVGTLLFLPVRLVLWGIRALEAAAGRPFELADTNWWIGAAAVLLGAVIAVGATLAVRALARRLRARD
ncbi:MAG TPA: hypothetical protein VMP42_07920 [Actinomycetota bacterium]|nr:hypothetical protein [Actinomycetota bacterium]